jgi:hypothetical protein
MYQPFAFGGGRINTSFNYQKTYRSKKDISLHTNLSYGFRNQDVNGSVRLSRKYNPFNRGFIPFRPAATSSLFSRAMPGST